jgi:hypothetical protein
MKMKDVKLSKGKLRPGLIIYTDSDYKGELNLLAGQKYQILAVGLRFTGHRELMANELGITIRSLRDRIIQHGVEKYFSFDLANELIINELGMLRKKYPLITMSRMEFDTKHPKLV